MSDVVVNDGHIHSNLLAMIANERMYYAGRFRRGIST
jgi:hypothetical protein